MVLDEIHYGIEPICGKTNTDKPYPINLTLKKDKMTCPDCRIVMIKKGIIKGDERDNTKRTRSRSVKDFKARVD